MSTRTIRAVRSIFVMIAIIGALLTVTSLVKGRGTASTVVLFAIGALPVAYFQLFLANYRLLIGAGQIGYRDAFGRPHMWSASQVDRIIDVAVTNIKNAPPRQVVYVLGLGGRRLFLINPTLWPDGALDRLAKSAGKRFEVRSTPITPADFKREFPMAVSWAGTHGVLLVAGAVIVAVVIAFAVVFVR